MTGQAMLLGRVNVSQRDSRGFGIKVEGRASLPYLEEPSLEPGFVSCPKMSLEKLCYVFPANVGQIWVHALLLNTESCFRVSQRKGWVSVLISHSFAKHRCDYY